LPHFAILAKDREIQTQKTKNSAEAEYKKGDEKKELLTMYGYLHLARTIFEQDSAI
jgi:hypothetical protein